MPRTPRLASLAIVAVLVAACSGTVAPQEATLVPPSVVPGDASPSSPSSLSPASPGSSTPEPTDPAPFIDAAWAQTELTDVATGETFRIADLAGRVVIVETMAIWCVNCLAQQGDVYAALDELDPERVAFVVLDVDPNETASALAQYRSKNGFTGTYAIAGREAARALAADFGDQVLNPPNTPMILIGTDGRITLTDFGQKSTATVVELAREHGA